jgi:hypothetical protein
MTEEPLLVVGDEVRYIGKDYKVRKGIYIVIKVDGRIIWLKHKDRIDRWKVSIHELKKEIK